MDNSWLKKSETANTQVAWDDRYRKHPNFLYSKQPSPFLVQFLDLIPEKAKILEVACGEGRNAVALATKGFDVLALDWSEVALERARSLAADSQVKVTWKTIDLDFFIPDLMTFDVIVSIDYRPQPTLLKNLARGLKQRGLLIMESHLMKAAEKEKSIEVFECFKPNELLKSIQGAGGSFLMEYYSELGSLEFGAKGDTKAFAIARKSNLL